MAAGCSVGAVVLPLLLLQPGDSFVIRSSWRRADPDVRLEYADLVPAATEYCYRQLVNDSNCCLDARMTPGVRSFVVRRPGTEWNCTWPLCRSEVPGLRGEDVVWVPAEADCSSPRILFVHGGSWIYGSPTTSGYAEFAARLADATGAMVMSLDYPLVAERQATSGQGNFDDIMAAAVSALRWLAEHGPREGCPTPSEAPLFIGGDSSGGGSGLSTAVLLNLQPELLPGRRLAGAFFYSPWTNLVCNSPEYYHNAFSKIEESTYNKIMMKNPFVGSFHRFRATPRNLTAYVGDVIFRTPPGETSTKFEMNAMGYVGDIEAKLTDPVASPYYASAAHLAGLPPLYFAVGSSESILGDSIVVAQNAAASGVEVHLDVHPGMWHVFPMYSEGCGGGRPLWNAVRAMNNTALFVRHISETGRPPYSVSMRGPVDAEGGRKQPYTTVSYSPAVPSLVEPDVAVGRHLSAVRELRQRRLRRAAKV